MSPVGSTVQVMTWNVQNASMFRAQNQLGWLRRVAPDVVVLTEVSAGPTGDRMARDLTDAGYSIQLPDPAPGADRYRVLLAARGFLTPVDTGLTVMPHRLTAARVLHADGGEFVVAGLYVPSRGPAEHRNVAKREFQQAVTDLLPKLAQQASATVPCIVTGDLNVVEPNHVPRYSVYRAWEYDFYRSFAASGFVDTYRLQSPHRVEHSWYGRPAKDGSRNGYRFDHCFVTAEHRDLVHACTYQHRPRQNELSDHSALTLTIRI
ncbi:endonuclease/exonuclease/phosphatase family protein [Nocardia sp. NPDC051570]|uniref:endonuclease/exonuclease/phosphatase family protein n=1 Tax=Nocardia sp. NPDC051570 TaxID=3364324 RepID=UPI0037BDB038